MIVIRNNLDGTKFQVRILDEDPGVVGAFLEDFMKWLNEPKIPMLTLDEKTEVPKEQLQDYEDYFKIFVEAKYKKYLNDPYFQYLTQVFNSMYLPYMVTGKLLLRSITDHDESGVDYTTIYIQITREIFAALTRQVAPDNWTLHLELELWLKIVCDHLASCTEEYRRQKAITDVAAGAMTAPTVH